MRASLMPLLMVPPAFLVAAGAYVYTCLHPRCELWGPVIHQGPPDVPNHIALTFDDGPTAGTTDRILDELKRLNVKATFFVIGRNAAAHPDLVRRMNAEGHLVCNHTFDHSHYGILRGPFYWKRQLDQTSDLLQKLIGIRPRYFRPPMGIRTYFVSRAARLGGMRVITWSRRGMDGMKTSPQRIITRLRDSVGARDIVILHDGCEPNDCRDQTATVEAVAPLVRAWQERGLELVRLDELLAPAGRTMAKEGV